MGVPALEDGLFANLFMFDYLWVFRYFCKGKRREWKGREKEREKGRDKGKGKGRQNGSPCVCCSTQVYSASASLFDQTIDVLGSFKTMELNSFVSNRVERSWVVYGRVRGDINGESANK